jgi:lipopolysaccharide transport system permease protein
MESLVERPAERRSQLSLSTSRTEPSQLPAVVIEPSGRFGAFRFVELWEYRELLLFFVWRNIKIRYKQTLLGAAWAILQPLLAALVFTLFFGKIAGIASDGVPYALFSFTGLVLWTFFAQGLNESSNSLVGSAHLITKVYFPRVMVPFAAVISGLLDLAVASGVLIIMMVVVGIPPTARFLVLPIPIALTIATAIGAGLWLSALNVKYRDVRYVVPFLIQMWLFLTPVIYPASEVAPRLAGLGVPEWMLGLNPMTGSVECFRWAVLGIDTTVWLYVASSSVSTIILLITGFVYFRSVERYFADVV